MALLERLALAQVLAEPLVIFPHRVTPALYDAIVALYRAVGRTPQVAQGAIQMQTIVNLVSARLGISWVPGSVRHFQRQGVVYRAVASAKGQSTPTCETSLVKAVPQVATLDRFSAFALGVGGF